MSIRGWLVVLLLAACCCLAAQEDLWRTYMDAGSRAQQRGNYTEAEKAFQDAINAGQGGGGTSDRVLLAMNALAIVYDKDKQPDKCEATLKSAIGLATQAQNDQQHAALLDVLSNMYQRWGRYQDALDTRKLEVATRERLPSAPDRALLSSLQLLAAQYESLGMISEAGKAYRRYLAAADSLYGQASPIFAKQALIFAAFCANHGQPEEAERMVERGLTAVGAVPLAEKRALLSDGQNVLAAFMRAKQWERADLLQGKLLPLIEAYEEPDAVAYFLITLADGQKQRKNYPVAEELLKRAADLVENSKGPDAPELADRLSPLELLYRDQGRLTEAEAVIQRRIAICERAKSPLLPAMLSDYAQLLRQMNRESEAAALEQRAAAIRDSARK